MEIREITQYHEKAPFTGYGIWIVFELKYRKAQLLHPIYLTELMMSEYELVKSSGNCIWPITGSNNFFSIEKFRVLFKERVQFFIEQKKSFPVNTVAKVIAELDNISEQEALNWIGSMAKLEEGKPTPMIFSKGTVQFKLNPKMMTRYYRGRRGIIIDAIRENGPASIYQLTHLVEGRLKTVTDLSRVVTYLVHNLQDQRILIPSIGENMTEHTHNPAATATEIATEKPKKAKVKVGDKPEATTTVIEQKEKAVRTPKAVVYRILNGVDVTKFSGQRACVVRAMQKMDSQNPGATFSLEEIVANVEGLVSKTPVEASVKYHLNGLVKDNQVELVELEPKVKKEEPKTEAA